jgi:multidrug efflux system membrane fusion protein
VPEPQSPPQQDPPPEGAIPQSNSPAPAPAHTASRHDAAASLRERLGVRIAGRIIGSMIIAGAIVLGVYVTHHYYIYPRTDDAYVRANVVGVAPHVSGPITELPVQDNQHVKQGQLLFVVDARPYRFAVDKAAADLALTNLQISALGDSIRAARARETQLQADTAYDRQYLERIQPLLSRHFVTANDIFNARSRLEAAEAAVLNAHSEVSKAQNELGQFGDINARRKAAEAVLYDARLNVGYCYVRAPFDAYVTNSISPSANTRTRAER